MAKTRSLEIILSEEQAERFFKATATTLRCSEWKAGEHIEEFCFESRPDEDGYTFSIDMIAPLELDEAPYIQLTIWDDEHDEEFSDVVNIGVAQRFHYPAVRSGVYLLDVIAPAKAPVIEMTRKVLRNEGDDIAISADGEFVIVDRELKAPKVISSKPTLYHVLYSYENAHEHAETTNWEEGMAFLESAAVAKVLQEITPAVFEEITATTGRDCFWNAVREHLDGIYKECELLPENFADSVCDTVCEFLTENHYAEENDKAISRKWVQEALFYLAMSHLQ